MSRRTGSALVALAVTVLGCGEAREIEARSQRAACARCHGGADSPTGAPTGDAHPRHVAALAGEESCAHCHPDPRLAPAAHPDGRVDVAFGALASDGGALTADYDPGDASCTAVYCHGAFRGGNEANAPAWASAGQGQGACGTCHLLPPPATHAAMPQDLTRCAGCHDGTIDAQGALIAGGGHLNGQVESRDDTCAACHPGVGVEGSARSSHVGDPPDATLCRSCHAAPPDGHYVRPAADASCVACHGGRGEAVGGRTPPLLVGWTDTKSGDFHGARAGAGYGGTLKAPYARGQAPLPCAACHDAHASGNAFLLAPVVNGTPVPAAAIDRAGVGAQVLCDACHEGARHAGCAASGCHASDPRPAGSACFWCHGHEGILQWTAPAPDHSYGSGCEHCHDFSQPPLEYSPPALAAAPVASGVTATGATFRWHTNEVATSYVEYGVGTAGWVAGSAALDGSHTVALTGLAPGTTYVWRVRSSDAYRNVTQSALQTFTTAGPDEIPRPDLAPVYAGTTVQETTAVATLLWYPVASPSGAAVEYEVQLASDPAFTSLFGAELARLDETLETGNSGWIAGRPTQDSSSPPRPALGFDVLLTNLPQDDCVSPPDPNRYYFRVRARDATGRVSGWSAPGFFTAMAEDPYC